jgi:hypothetical protein
LSVRKEGRYFFYALQRDVLRGLVDDLWLLAPEVAAELGDDTGEDTGQTRSETTGDALAGQVPGEVAASRREPVLMTW